MKFLNGTSATGFLFAFLLFTGCSILQFLQEIVVRKVRRMPMTKTLLYQAVNSSFVAVLQSLVAALVID
jgi:hypothetical protein